MLLQQQKTERARRAHKTLRTSADNPFSTPHAIDGDRSVSMSNSITAKKSLRSHQTWAVPAPQANSTTVIGQTSPQLLHHATEETPICKASDGSSPQSTVSGRRTPQRRQTAADNALGAVRGDTLPPAGVGSAPSQGTVSAAVVLL